ncbi:lamin tail domain-containing protein [Verrucomicrobiaceae bacterium 227]
MSFRFPIAPFASLALFISPPAVMAAADSVLVFNEIHYHPADEVNDTEWLELRSLMGVDVDVSGWSIDRGVSFTFPEGTVVPGRGFILLAADPSNPSLSGKNAMGPFVGQLSNSGEELRLVNNNGRIMDVVSYGDDNDWPVGADGTGATLTKRSEDSAQAAPSNWVASPAIGGTPAALNFPTSTQAPVTTIPIPRGAEWKFRDSNTPPPADWTFPNFDDSSWTSGNATFHAGEAGDTGAGVGLLGYWPLDETSGTSAPNEVAGGQSAQLFNGATWFNDPTRGRVLSFDGTNDYVNAGSIPQQTTSNNFTWSFWAYDQQGASNNVIVGNRYSPTGADFSPREFIKFTTNQFEWHRNGGSGGDLNHAPITQNTWVHHAIVKDGTSLTYYRNGVTAGSSTITGGTNNPQPFYFGGDQANESWQGRLDDPAIWEAALPATSIAGLANGSFTPLTAPTEGGAGPGNLETKLSDATDTSYFRQSFTFSGNPARTNLTLQLLVDDGAVVSLNGVEVHRENMPTGVISHTSFAASDIDQAVLTSGIPISSNALVQGRNVLAISLHQSSAASEDALFDATLSATELPPDPTAFETNLVLSEISSASDPQFRLELANLGSSPLDLAGYVIASSGGASYTFTTGTIAPGEQLSVNAGTLGFTTFDGDRLSVLRPGQTELADSRVVTNRLRGLDSTGRWSYPTSPSFGSANSFEITSDIVINEVMYNPSPIRSEPTPPVTLLDWDANWRYNEAGEDLGNDWELSPHPVGGNWFGSAGPIGFETSAPPIPFNTNIQRPNGNAVYFETEFTLTSLQLAEIDLVQMSHQIDDGAIFYLNGVEIERYKMNGEPTTFSTLANSGGEATLISGIEIPAKLFQVGSNRLSVEVHQNSAGSSDIVFGLKLESLQPFVPFEKSDEQWIELHNRGTSDIDLSAWAFTDGISFIFPDTTTLNAGGYLVVARDASSLSSKYPGITILGDWDGNLSRSGERIILRDLSQNVVDEVRYFDAGRWPAQSDGGGSSLELIDPAADNQIAESWAPSDEASRSSWQTYSYRAPGTNHGNDPTQYHEFIFGLLDNGEFLIDDISVIEDPDGTARQLIQNGDFSSGDTEAWRLIGTHRHAEVVSDGGNQVLHMTTTGSTEHQHNHASTTLKNGGSYVTTNSGNTYEISFRAKWLSGSNQLHTRLYFNRAARTTLLTTPDGGGTPGAANSKLVANAGPTLSGLSHQPAVPAANESVLVKINAADPDGLATLTLHYAVNGGAFQSSPMTDLENGQWSGIVPGQSTASKIQFYLEAVDNNGAISFFPAEGPDSRALIPVADGQSDLDYGDCQPNNFRIVMTDDDRDFMHTLTNVMSNDRLGCTVIWNESEVYYGCSVRLKGSQRGRPQDVRVGFNVRFPADHLFLGAHETVAIDRSGSGNQFSQKEILVKHTINHAGGGIPGMEDDLIRVIAPKSQHTSSAMLLKSRYDSEWMDNMYENGGDGTAWEFELIYYPTTTVGGIEGLKSPNPDSVAGVSASGLGSDPELYRWHWLIKNNRDADNYAPLIEMLQSYGQGASAGYLADMDRLLDVDQFLRSFAVQILFGIGDNYSSGSSHNAMFYQRPGDGKFLYFPWDMDFAFSQGATSSITPSGDLNKLLTSPANRRAYYGHLQDIVSTSYNSGYLSPWATHYSCFLPTENLSGFISYINTRSSYALSQINNAIPQVTFGLTTGNGSTSDSTFTVEGDGWVDVREIRLAGTPGALPVTWLDTNSFRFDLPVQPGTRTYTIEAYDFEGALIGFDNITVTGNGTVAPAAAGLLVISELMYHPDVEAYEFLEFLNTSELTLDLEGMTFTEGIAYTFPAVLLPPGERIVLARDHSAFRSRYGNTPLVAGEYQAPDGSNKLSDKGEQLTLLDALGSLILDFSYRDDAPWPTSADGEGYSLELINATSGIDPSDPMNWRSSRQINGTPGTSDSEDLTNWAISNGIIDLSLDPDLDGYNHLAEFVFMTNPFVSDAPVTRAEIQDNTIQMELVVRNGADGILFSGEKSADLKTWSPTTYAGRLNNGDGQTSTLFFHGSEPATGAREFLRAHLTTQP